MHDTANNMLPIIGWREWVALPDLNIIKIKAKIDTGARTSTLHAFDVKHFKVDGRHKVSFSVHPARDQSDIIKCVADLTDIRWITDSSGRRERRYVICTTLQIADQAWKIELTLRNRDDMRFRMLLGRTAIKHNFVINPAVSYLTKKTAQK